MKAKNKGLGLMLSGLLLMAAALGLFLLNQSRQAQAASASAAAAEPLIAQIRAAALSPEEAGEETAEDAPSSEAPPVPAEEPRLTVEGREYIGLLEIPELALCLPILSDCTEELLEFAPCRYSGRAMDGDLVIAGHNYDSHFGSLGELTVGSAAYFTDAAGTIYEYVLAEVAILYPTAVEAMTEGVYPLTLFTCTWGGRSRVTLRFAYGG